MKTINTRPVETSDERSHVYALRYDYYVVARELDIAADHRRRLIRDKRDAEASQYATFAGDDLVGCFRAEIGSPESLSFGADWAFTDFLEDMPQKVALISGLCTVPHLRDSRVITHMVRESVAIAKEFDLPHVFFETCPELWPEFHAAGLTRKGGSLTDANTGLQSAVFVLDCQARLRFPKVASNWTNAADACDIAFVDEIGRPMLAIVMGGRG